jgi:hypothetical protein
LLEERVRLGLLDGRSVVYVDATHARNQKIAPLSFSTVLGAVCHPETEVPLNDLVHCGIDVFPLA